MKHIRNNKKYANKHKHDNGGEIIDYRKVKIFISDKKKNDREDNATRENMCTSRYDLISSQPLDISYLGISFALGCNFFAPLPAKINNKNKGKA
jgi:hypothetical protein